MGKRRAKLLERGALPSPERTGLFTTAIVAFDEAGRTIALFFTGRQHAGENLTDLLNHRAQELEPPVLMCDALARNLPKGHQVVESNCASHGRRHFVDEAENFPSECRYLLEMLGRVFKVDELCRTYRLSDEQRLRLHQRESGPVMEELKLWMEAEFEEKRIEPNSGMGNAINYMLKRWNKFTLFLRRPGAPLHNNIVERTLKRAIRHRNNSLFYRSQRGAHVGDIYMSLIYTTELHGGNAFHYLTTLMLHEKAVADSPSDWLPWNYRESLARLDGLAHHPSTPTDVVTSDSEPVIDMRGPPLMAMPRRPPRHHNLNSSAGLSTAASALILSADRPFAGGRPNWPPLEARSFAPHLPRTAAGRTRNITVRIAIYRKRVRHRTAKNFQLDLFSPDDGYFEYSAVATNKSLTVQRLWYFAAGRGGQEKTFAELRSQFALDVVPTKSYAANSAWQQLNVLAHNLCRSFQLDTIAETKGISRKRTCTHLLHTIRTIRFRIINKAGRLVRVSGRNALRMATNSSTQTLFERIELALAS